MRIRARLRERAPRLVYAHFAPDGHAALVQELAAEGESESFYPPPFIPGTLSLPTRTDMSAGQYTIVLAVRDMLGKQSFTGRYGFTLE